MDSKLRALRKTSGLSQTEVAEMVGVSQFMVSQWERGLRPVPDNRLVELAPVLGVTADELRDWKHSPKMTAKAPTSWRDFVIDSDLEMDPTMVLVVLPTFIDKESGVVTVGAQDLADAARMDLPRLNTAMETVLTSGFVRRIGTLDYVFELTYPD